MFKKKHKISILFLNLKENQKRIAENDAELRKQYEVITNKEFEYKQEMARTKSELDGKHYIRTFFLFSFSANLLNSIL